MMLMIVAIRPRAFISLFWHKAYEWWVHLGIIPSETAAIDCSIAGIYIGAYLSADYVACIFIGSKFLDIRLHPLALKGMYR